MPSWKVRRASRANALPGSNARAPISRPGLSPSTMACPISRRLPGAPVDPADPALPEGAQPLADHVAAPPELARRLKQIGVVAREDGARLAALLKPGQRLVSREGDLWRWDGFAAGAHAPTGA